jgi:hypothetical protein
MATTKLSSVPSVSAGPKVSASQAASINSSISKLNAGIASYNSSSNPVTSSTATRAENTRLGVDISGLQSAYAAEQAQIAAQQAALAERRKLEVDSIKSEFDVAKAGQEVRQGQDYAARSTSLVTSGGGFLGATQSQQGVLQNLKGTFEAEKTALMSKREAAILAAQTAYEDKDFALAREKTKLATDLQKEIYTRQSDYADQTLKIAAANRAQTEFDMGITDKKVASYAMMSDAEFKAQNPADIATLDAQYYPGYTENARVVAKKALDTKTNKDAVALDADILDMRLKMPAGQKFTLNGQSYTGLKQADGGGTQSDRDREFRQKINSFFSPGYTIPNTQIETVGSDGYANPQAWKLMYSTSGLDRKDYVTQYGYLINPANIKDYGISNAEMELVRGKI